MKRTRWLLILSLSAIISAACSSKGSRSSAFLPISGAETSLQLERVCIHHFLAEYDRRLILNVRRKAVAQVQISTDTGGRSRANVFFRAADSMLIVQDPMATYEVDVARQSIREVSSECASPKDSVFVGAFDVDESKGWRFIRAAERKRLPMSVSGCANARPNKALQLTAR
jgi:hypothetical protein